MKMSPQASWRTAALLRRKAARLLPSRAYRYREMARDFEWLARAKAKLQQEADRPGRDAVRRLGLPAGSLGAHFLRCRSRSRLAGTAGLPRGR